ncbi:MAG TPA: hypothetical protein PK876_03895 [Elusimicrobiota bacterium]|nr:hypothetical protein [Elusimicrobiota bacterium]
MFHTLSTRSLSDFFPRLAALTKGVFRVFLRPVPGPITALFLSSTLLTVHAALCIYYLSMFNYISLTSNSFCYGKFILRWLQDPGFFLAGAGFPALPLLTYAPFVKLFNNDILLSFPVTEIFVSGVGVILLYKICRELLYSEMASFLITLVSLFQYEHVRSGVLSEYNDNFFLTTILWAAYFWILYRRTGLSRHLSLAAIGCLGATMSRWEGFIIPILFTTLMALHSLTKPHPLKFLFRRGSLPLLISFIYVILNFIKLVILPHEGTPLDSQITGYSVWFTPDFLSPLHVYIRDVFGMTKNVYLFILSLIVVAIHLPRIKNLFSTHMGGTYLLFPATIFVSYLIFTFLRLGTPKIHVWPGFLLCLPLLFLPIHAHTTTRPHRLFAAGYAAAISGYFIFSFYTGTIRMIDEYARSPEPVYTHDIGMKMRRWWKNGVVKGTETILMETWEGGVGHPMEFLPFTYVYKSPDHIFMDKMEPFYEHIDRHVVLKYYTDHIPTHSLSELKDAIWKNRIKIIAAHSPKLKRLLAGTYPAIDRHEDMVFYHSGREFDPHTKRPSAKAPRRKD